MSTSRQSGFTLVELVLVIAIIAMISVLAIGKYAGVRDASKAKLNLANFSRIGASVDTFVALNDGALDRLDSLLYYQTSTGGTNDSNLSSSIPARLTDPANATNGVVLNPALCTDTSGYGISSGGLLCPYFLSAADVAALRNHLGLKYAMYGTDGGHFLEGDDGAWAQGSLSDPARASSVAKALTNGLCVACVNPGAFSGTTPTGGNVYQACGQDVRYTSRGVILVDGVRQANAQGAFATLDAGPGILLAFGLGESASIVGNNKAGLDHAPICPLVSDPLEYNYYLVLIRLRTNESGVRIAEYAGLIDSMGNTVSMARALAK